MGFAGLCFLTLAIWLFMFQGINLSQYIQLNSELRSTQQEQEVPKAEGQTTEILEVVDLIDRSSLVLGLVSDQNVAIQIGMSSEEILQNLGDPDRVELSAYGYEWWIYNEYETYVQVGIKDNLAVTLFTNVPSWQINGISPGSSFEALESIFTFTSEINVKHGLGYYTFVLTEADLNEKPLSVLNGVGIQFYLDIHDNLRVSSMRLMDMETLLLMRPYSIKYIGSLPSPPELNQEEQEQVNVANEWQIFDLTNNIRKRNGLGELAWDELVSEVARSHSIDMLRYDFFDHTSPNTGDLGDRLIDWNVTFLTAGENIAWNYLDGIDAHEGWMNSLGHRKNILQESYNMLGVGVVERYYTQNFVLR